MSAPRANRLRDRLRIDPDAAAAPAPASAPAPTPPAAFEVAIPPAPRPKPEALPAAYEPPTALDDPDIVTGRNGYRSFYVDDEVFARFRAAVYWLSRREDALGSVPANMSSAVETFMRETADDLEKRFNDGAVFRATPDQLKKPRRRRRNQ